MSLQKVSNEQIKTFLEGSNPLKHVISIEGGYSTNSVDLIINDPQSGKYITTHPYKPFIWFRLEVKNFLYGGKGEEMQKAAEAFGVKTKKLITADNNGNTTDRLANGYTYIATCSRSYNNLISFFKKGGVDIFDEKWSKFFFYFTPVEQFMIQTGIRLFKGIDDYNELHRFQFDLETEGLIPQQHAIFQIGMRDNKGFELVLETIGDTLAEKRDCERKNIRLFFETIDAFWPDIIAGYNSSTFDWNFIYGRCERLGLNIEELAKGKDLNGLTTIKKRQSMLKLGNEMEPFEQVYLYGHNIIDIAHSVRRAQAINSDIKKWNLKYITKYSEIAKPNRVYVAGDKIHSTWEDVYSTFALNNKNGDWYKISDRMPLKEGYKEVDGAYIVQRYLLDDLWETEQVDIIFNQAAFLIAKLLPTTYSRSTTMGTASQWKLIMAAWSYQNDLAIPLTEPKRDFTGGLARLLQVGFAKNVYKFDYAALYPKTQLTHDIFPALDISGVMKGLLTYIVDTRDEFKFLTGKQKKIVDKLINEYDINEKNYDANKLLMLKEETTKNKALQNIFDKKQLPLKILANSWFGAYGAPYIFNWGDTNCAEETTCRGRQYLRLMVKHFVEKYGFKPLVMDSVTFDTPVYIKQNGLIDIKPICELFNENSLLLDSEGLRDYEQKPYQILTVNGWKEIKYVYRHETNKNIHRVTTKDRLVNVTEDHSLFQNGIQIKPSILKRGDKIDVYESENSTIINNITLDKAWLYGFFLGDGSALCGKRKDSRYISKKTKELHTYLTSRSDWKISNSNVKHLEKLQEILKKEFGVDGLIKNHLKSSGVYNLVFYNADLAREFCNNFYTSYREKKVPDFILNSNNDIKRAFINGVCASDGYGDTIETYVSIGMKSQTAIAGIAMCLKNLGIEYKVITRLDKPNFITLSLKNIKYGNISDFANKSKKKTDEIWTNYVLPVKNKFVYDISTTDGTFIGGIGLINLKNTDGVNLEAPKNINDITYVAKGSHWKTEGLAGQKLVGIQAVLAEFNETFMFGRMGLDLDEECDSTINFSRKNYANKISSKKGTKIKFVGNSIKSKKMPVYIEDFLDIAIKLLLDDRGKDFINLYNEHVDKIYNYNIPLVKIASKSKVKCTIKEYKAKANKKNKAGNPMPKQAHMELAILNNLNVNLGDTLYYVNTGTSKTHGDIKTLKIKSEDPDNKEIKTELQINCKLIDPNIVESNFELLGEIESLKKQLSDETDGDKKNDIELQINQLESQLVTDEYNVQKYLENFNKKVKPLLVCFSKEIRDKILLTIKKDKKTKVEKLDERFVFNDDQCKLTSGEPYKPTDQDTYEALMTMEDKEIRFWDSVNKVPNNMDESTWTDIRIDYYERMVKLRENEIQNEKDLFVALTKHLEVPDFVDINKVQKLPPEFYSYLNLTKDGKFLSRKWNVEIGCIEDIFKYEEEAKIRFAWYQSTNNINNTKRYDLWEKYKEKNNITFDIVEDKKIDIAEHIEEYKEPIVKSDDEHEEDEDDEEIIDDFLPELQKLEYIDVVNFSDEQIIIDKPIVSKETNQNKPAIHEYLNQILKKTDNTDVWNF